MIQIKKTILTLVALLAVTTGAWADETPLLTIESKDYTSFTSGSMTFDDMVTVTFSNEVYNNGNEEGWYSNNGSLLTVTGINGFTITSCKFYTKAGTAANGYTVEGESPSVYLAANVYTDDSKSKYIGYTGVTKIEVYGTAPSAGSAVTVDWNKASKTGTFTMPGGNVELEPEYYPGMLTLGNAIEGGKLEVVGMGLGTTSFTVPSEWNHNITSLTSGHFEGFKSVTEEEAKAWPGVPATGLVALFYNYDETEQKWDMIYFKDGAFYQIYKGYKQQLTSIYNLSKSNFSVFYTTGMQMPAGFEKDEEGNIYVEPGTKFQVKAVPDEGYHLVSLTDGTNDIEVDADGIATITMPDEYADLTLTATFSNEYDITFVEGTNPDPENPEWTATPNPAKTNQTVTVTYTGSKKVLGVKAEKKVAAPAGPVTYTELKGGEVLHVGDILSDANLTYLFSDFNLLPGNCPFTVIRANITGDEEEPTVTPADDGAYYVIQDKEGDYYFIFKNLPVTATSDGILITITGENGNYRNGNVSVHEP